jgi:hypothetical protein
LLNNGYKVAEFVNEGWRYHTGIMSIDEGVFGGNRDEQKCFKFSLQTKAASVMNSSTGN